MEIMIKYLHLTDNVFQLSLFVFLSIYRTQFQVENYRRLNFHCLTLRHIKISIDILFLSLASMSLV